MLLTLFVDASHCQKTKVAGFGSWAKRKDWPTGRFAGGVLGNCRNAAEAELRGVAAALAQVEIAEDVDAIMLQSDCLRALQLIRIWIEDAHASNNGAGAPIPSAPLKPTEHERESLALIRAVNRRLMLRHVRGHKDGDGRQWVNAQCDQVARSWMRGARTKALISRQEQDA